MFVENPNFEAFSYENGKKVPLKTEIKPITHVFIGNVLYLISPVLHEQDLDLERKVKGIKQEFNLVIEQNRIPYLY